jgi:hypothetical protein
MKKIIMNVPLIIWVVVIKEINSSIYKYKFNKQYENYKPQ